MTPTPKALDAAYAGFAPAMARLRDIAALEEFRADAPPLEGQTLTARVREISEEVAALGGEVDGAMTSVFSAIKAAEMKNRPTNPGAQLMFAQSQRTGGPPHPLASQWRSDPPADWAAALVQADANRQVFRFWASTVADFRKRAAARIAKLG